MARSLDNVLNLIRQHEGLRLMPYVDSVGKLTIGYGRNLEDNGITVDEAELMLMNDVKKAIRDAYRIFNNFHELEPARQDVIINMLYNLGYAKFRTFVKFIDAVNERNFDRAVIEMEDSLWCKQVGVRCQQLKEIMQRGTY